MVSDTETPNREFPKALCSGEVTIGDSPKPFAVVKQPSGISQNLLH